MGDKGKKDKGKKEAKKPKKDKQKGVQKEKPSNKQQVKPDEERATVGPPLFPQTALSFWDVAFALTVGVG